MNQHLPRRLYEYKGPITDARRWSLFQHRPNDIFICAPAKSGMTWTQAICAFLIFGPDADVQPAKLSPWLDSNLTPAVDVMQLISAQTHRRYFKTHTPLDGIPYFPDCIYLAVYRDPRDSFLSMMRLSFKTARSQARDIELHKMISMWLQTPFVPGRGEQPSLASTVHHYQSFWKFRAMPNIHLFHYADLKEQPVESIRKMGNAIGFPVDLSTSEKIADKASFANMQRNSSRFAPGIGRGSWRAEADFFRRGENEQWRDVFTSDELAEYRARMAVLLPTDMADWLERGSAAGRIRV